MALGCCLCYSLIMRYLYFRSTWRSSQVFSLTREWGGRASFIVNWVEENFVSSGKFLPYFKSWNCNQLLYWKGFCSINRRKTMKMIILYYQQKCDQTYMHFKVKKILYCFNHQIIISIQQSNQKENTATHMFSIMDRQIFFKLVDLKVNF